MLFSKMSKALSKKGTQLKLLSKAEQLLREEEASRIYQEYEKRETLHTTLIAPDLSKNAWNKASVGRMSDGKELVIDLNITPTVFMQGMPGSGKTCMTNAILNHCLSHAEQWEIIIFDATHFEDFDYLDNPTYNKSVKIFKNKVDIVTAIQRLYKLWQSRTQSNALKFKHIMIPIGDFEYFKEQIAQENYSSTFSHEQVSKDEARKTLAQLQTLIQVGGSHGIHFIIESYNDEIDPIIRRSIERGIIKHLGLGRKFLKDNVTCSPLRPIYGMGTEMGVENNEYRYFKGYISERSLNISNTLR